MLDGDDPYLAVAADAGGKEQISDLFVGGCPMIAQGRHALQQQSSTELLQM